MAACHLNLICACVQLQKSFVFLVDISGYVVEALSMHKKQYKKLEKKVSPKLLDFEVSEKFTLLASRFDRPVEWLAKLACDLFADDPPSEIIDLTEKGKA